MSDGVFVLNRDGWIIASNPAVESILGLTHAELLGR
jgi:PAS domain S-box-containing protein